MITQKGKAILKEKLIQKGKAIQRRKSIQKERQVQKSRHIQKGVRFLCLAGLAGIVCFPILIVLCGAFCSQWELEEKLSPVLAGTEGSAFWTLLPLAPTLASLVELLMDLPQFFVLFWNSVKLALLIPAGQLFFGAPAAWGLARFSFPGKRAVTAMYLILMLMPFQVMMLPQYLAIRRLHLLDTHAGMVLPAVFSTFPVFLMYRGFLELPEAVLEAAKIDGAGDLQSFLKIGIPLGRPALMSAALLGFLEAWNLIEQPMTFLKTRSLWPLSLFLPELRLSDAGLGFAVSLLMLIPALLVFLGGQEYLEQGIRAAAVKE